MEVGDFAAFFAAVNNGHRPFKWQERLLAHVVSGGAWPQEITAPTGAGKSVVVEVHVFANALAALGLAPRIPRRLCVCVGRRALVDQHELRALDIRQALNSPQTSLLAEMHDALWRLCGTDAVVSEDASEQQPFAVHSLRGGVPVNRDWIDDPSQCAVIAVTPDMWGSRALFRGYGSSIAARPREAGLLVMDDTLVIDEAHLSQQLLVTARDIAQLSQRDAAAVGLPSLQVVAMTATPTSAAESRIELVDEDLADSALAMRLTAQKPVRYEEAQGSSLAPRLAALAQEMSEQLPPSDLPQTVGVVVNRVDTAVRVADLLSRVTGEDQVVCWVGRKRPADLLRDRERWPGLFSVQGDARIRFLVATQTIEVGIDLDLAGLVTELAPGSALAQRSGRVNRLGRRAAASVIVVGPQSAEIKDAPPYSGGDLVAAFDWVDERSRDVAGLAPWVLARDSTRPPAAAIGRPILSRVRHHLIAELSQTAPSFAEYELAFQLRDSLEPDVDPVGVVLRHPLPQDDSAALGLLKATPPDPREEYPTRIGLAKKIARRLLDQPGGRAFLSTPQGVEQIDSVDVIRPGNTLLLDRQPLTRFGVVVDSDPKELEEAPSTFWGATGVRVLVGGADDALLARFEDCTAEEAAEVAMALPEQPPGALQVVLGPAMEGEPPAWVVLRPEAQVIDDPELRQVWTTGQRGGRVTLYEHGIAVQERAALISDHLGLLPPARVAVEAAGLYHDSGKADQRFQRWRLSNTSAEPLAKSADRYLQTVQRRQASSPLPVGWRHEQLSAAICWLELEGVHERALATRLVGTSHGRGRPLFNHGVVGLRGAGDAGPIWSEEVQSVVTELFATGDGWQDVWDDTQREFGPWGCAALEAVVRSADCMISKEGR